MYLYLLLIVQLLTYDTVIFLHHIAWTHIPSLTTRREKKWTVLSLFCIRWGNSSGWQLWNPGRLVPSKSRDLTASGGGWVHVQCHLMFPFQHNHSHPWHIFVLCFACLFRLTTAPCGELPFSFLEGVKLDIAISRDSFWNLRWDFCFLVNKHDIRHKLIFKGPIVNWFPNTLKSSLCFIYL